MNCPTWTPENGCTCDDENHGEKPVAKVKAVKIVLTRAEGLSSETGTRTVEGATLWALAAGILIAWAETAPKRKYGVHKCDFKIYFEDGQTYSGRYDLRHISIERPDLAAHVRGNLEFDTGKHKPHWMEEDEYAAYIKEQEKENPGFGEACEEWLKTYQIGDTEGVPA